MRDKLEVEYGSSAYAELNEREFKAKIRMEESITDEEKRVLKEQRRVGRSFNA